MGRRYSFLYIVLGSAMVFSLFVVGGERLRGQSGDVTALGVADASPYVYQLEFGGQIVGEYTECSGLGWSAEIVESSSVNKTGGSVIQKTPGVLHWRNIVLKRMGPGDAYEWSYPKVKENENAVQVPLDGSITMLSAAGPSTQWLGRWIIRRGWISGLTLNQGVEELTITLDGLEWATSSNTSTASRSRS